MNAVSYPGIRCEPFRNIEGILSGDCLDSPTVGWTGTDSSSTKTDSPGAPHWQTWSQALGGTKR